MAGIIDYEPGDLTLTARAGTTLAEIDDVTGPERQWLTFDPAGSDAGTIGATVATASAGPLAHAFGLPRDAVLGVEAVVGDGRVVRGGGRVVKNVAGFDLTRLFVGSWGTLGVITEVTVRLRARPEVDETFVLPASALDHVRRADIAPLAVEMLNAALARRLALADDALLLIRLAGNAASVQAQRLALGGDPAPAHVWITLRAIEPAGALCRPLGRGRVAAGRARARHAVARRRPMHRRHAQRPRRARHRHRRATAGRRMGPFAHARQAVDGYPADV
jgi:FAD/FMN-containing dehydrogenase